MYRILHSPLRSNLFGLDDAAAAALIVGASSAGVSMYNNHKQRKEQRSLMDKSIDANIQQWNRENQYNTPQAQMNRFKNAGLNPNLIYGQSNTASSMTPSTDVPEAKMPHNSVAEGIANMQQMQQMQNQQKLTDSQVELNVANAEKARAEAGLPEVQIKHYEKDIEKMGIELNLAKETINNLQKQNQILTENLNLAREELKEKRFKNSVLPLNFLFDMRETMARTRNYLSSSGYSDAQRAFLMPQISLAWKTLDYKVRSAAAEANSGEAQTDLIHQQIILNYPNLARALSMSHHLKKGFQDVQVPFLDDGYYDSSEMFPAYSSKGMLRYKNERRSVDAPTYGYHFMDDDVRKYWDATRGADVFFKDAGEVFNIGVGLYGTYDFSNKPVFGQKSYKRRGDGSIERSWSQPIRVY